MINESILINKSVNLTYVINKSHLTKTISNEITYYTHGEIPSECFYKIADFNYSLVASDINFLFYGLTFMFFAIAFIEVAEIALNPKLKISGVRRLRWFFIISGLILSLILALMGGMFHI